MWLPLEMRHLLITFYGLYFSHHIFSFILTPAWFQLISAPVYICTLPELTSIMSSLEIVLPLCHVKFVNPPVDGFYLWQSFMLASCIMSFGQIV